MKITEIIELSVKPVSFQVKNIWVYNTRCHDGGYFRRVKEKCAKLLVRFEAKVDGDILNGIYESDTGIKFRAIDTNRIVNYTEILDHFEIPKEFILLYSPVFELNPLY